MPLNSPKDPYQVLGVPQSANPDEITAVYRRQARKYHPDINPGPEANARMQEINWAYGILNGRDGMHRYGRAADSSPASRHANTARSSRQGPEEPANASEPPGKFEESRTRILGVQLGMLREAHASSLAGALAALTVFGVANYLSDAYIGVLATLPALWLVALLPAMGPDRRPVGFLGMTLVLLGSSVACGALAKLTADSTGLEGWRIGLGQAHLLLAIPASAIVGSLVGLLRGRT